MTGAGETLLILGASGRACAASARRAGFKPIVLDLFADADTELIAETHLCPLEEYPRVLFDRARELKASRWVYTGGLENEPELIQGLMQHHALLGNGPGQLKRVRDPIRFHHWLDELGLPHPRTLPPGSELPGKGTWLQKPLGGAGGLGISIASTSTNTHYLQEFVAGEPMSAVFVIHPDEEVLLGFTQQLIGETWLHAPQFHYAGNIGPVDLPVQDQQSIFDLLTAFRREGLIGIGSVDFLMTPTGIRILEVNPRYPASAEVLELGGELSTMAWHSWAAGLGPRPQLPVSSSTVIGKAIYYARESFRFPVQGPWLDSLSRNRGIPAFADIPKPDSMMGAGHPVCTLLVSGNDAAAARDQLHRRAEQLDQLLLSGSKGSATCLQ